MNTYKLTRLTNQLELVSLAGKTTYKNVISKPEAGKLVVETRIVVARVPRETRMGISVPARSLSLSNKQLSAFRGVLLATIPNLTISIGNTVNMNTYISDPDSRITSSRIINLNTSLASYSSATRILTATASGTMTGLQLEVTYT